MAVKRKRDFPPIHPGDLLYREFLKPLKISQYRLAKDLNVPARRINEIIHGKRGISADTALRLSRYFSTTPEFWLNMQMLYEKETLEELMFDKIEQEVKVFSRATSR